MLARLKTHWRLKLLLFLAINSIFWTCYQILSRHAFFPLRTVPATVVDEVIPMRPGFWSWVYLSQFLVTGLLPLLLTTREEIRRYASSLAFMSLVGFSVFFFFPTRGPRPSQIEGSLAMQIIAGADGPLNALPSLHAAFVVCMSCLAWRMFGLRAIALAFVWGIAILYSTLATKQHYALDVLAGGVLGWLADWLSWRGASAAATIPVSSGMASQCGER
jgi:membrane-associated phospholipid phosphatase